MSFFILLFAHFMGDFPLQGSFLSTHKGKYPYLLFVHCFIWTGCIAAAGYLIGYTITFIDLGLLFSLHALADYLKAKPALFYKKADPLRTGLYIDQFIHILQLLLFMMMH
ncbi:DUF3307 domain-containing protein [Niallia sp. Krafla_26]|uniref:DUF3307 domain-containing protein n=1 Tax=Niallia sp. Krafla_26 TaxID=3064703 RepID=UPI003D184BEC